jgi:hypothetical protein
MIGEGEDCSNSAVRVMPRFQPQLSEDQDARSLNGPLTDPQPFGDARIRASLSHTRARYVIPTARRGQLSLGRCNRRRLDPLGRCLNRRPSAAAPIGVRWLDLDTLIDDCGGES